MILPMILPIARVLDWCGNRIRARRGVPKNGHVVERNEITNPVSFLAAPAPKPHTSARALPTQRRSLYPRSHFPATMNTLMRARVVTPSVCAASAPTRRVASKLGFAKTQAAKSRKTTTTRASAPTDTASTSRRAHLASIALAPLAAALVVTAVPPPALADTECTECSNSNSSLAPGDVPFQQSVSGARFADLRVGDGAKPLPGQTVVIEWVGYTAGYQAKKIENSRETDTPFVFVVGAGTAIPAFEEAVLEMKQGGIRRIEIPGELEEKLAYSRDKSQRYTVGPEPSTFGGKRTLDFVLDNKTLKDFNRTLLFDIRLSNIRK